MKKRHPEILICLPQDFPGEPTELVLPLAWLRKNTAKLQRIFCYWAPEFSYPETYFESSDTKKNLKGGFTQNQNAKKNFTFARPSLFKRLRMSIPVLKRNSSGNTEVRSFSLYANLRRKEIAFPLLKKSLFH